MTRATGLPWLVTMRSSPCCSTRRRYSSIFAFSSPEEALAALKGKEEKVSRSADAEAANAAPDAGASGDRTESDDVDPVSKETEDAFIEIWRASRGARRRRGAERLLCNQNVFQE